MSFLLPIVLALTFVTSLPLSNKVNRGPVSIDDRACLAPCRIDEKGNLSCRCGEVRPKS